MSTVRRNKHSAGFKCGVIEYAKENGNRSAARVFGVCESSVREWRKNERIIINMPKNKCALRRGVKKSAQPCGSNSSEAKLKTNVHDVESSKSILPDIEPGCQNSLYDPEIVIKQEIIETEPGPSTFDDSSLVSFHPAMLESSSSFQSPSLTTDLKEPSASEHGSSIAAESSNIDSSFKVVYWCDDWDGDQDRSSAPNPKKPADGKMSAKKNDRLPSGQPSTTNEVPTPKQDKFDISGEFIASKLRDLDPRSRAFIQTAIADLIFEAELGRYISDEEKSIFHTRTNELLKSMPSPFPNEENHAPSTVDSSTPSCQPVTSQTGVTRTESLSSSHSTVQRNQTLDNVAFGIGSDDDWNNGKDRSFERPAYRKVYMKKNDRVPSVGQTSFEDGSENPKDKFDIYGGFIASKLPDLDQRSCAFVQTAIADLIFEAELGRYLSAGEKSIFATRTNEFLKSMPSPLPKNDNEVLN